MTVRLLVLVVEDDDSMRRAVGRLLRAAGFDSREFASAEAVLESDETASASCVVSDIHLPGMSGFDLVDNLRARHGRMPAVFVTAFGTQGLRDQALQRSGAAYLTKPFEGAALLAAIRKVTAVSC